MSTIKTIALTPRQYLSHIWRKRGWPPKSQHLSVTCPFCTRFMLKPTVGMVLQCEVSRGKQMRRVKNCDHVDRQDRETGRRDILTRSRILRPAGKDSCQHSAVRPHRPLRSTHRQHPEKGGFARVLKPNHRHVHLGCPARGPVLDSVLDGLDGMEPGKRNPAT